MTLLRLDSGLACCAAHAAAEIAETLRLPVEKAIDPLTRGGYLRIVAQVRRALEETTAEAEAAAVRTALQHLDVDWANMTPAAREAVAQAARDAIGVAASRAMPRVRAVLSASGTRIMGETRVAARRRYAFEIGTSLSARDRAAERYVRISTANFIRDHYGVRADQFSARAREIVARGLEQGLGREEIARSLRLGLGNRIMRGRSYWQVVAGQFVNSARTFSQLGSFQAAGIERYEFSAILDEVTTDECRFYDGQTFPMGTAIAARDRLASLRNPDDVYRVAPWVRSGRMEDGTRAIYVDRGDGREVIATIDQSGVGTQSRGSYSNALSGSALAAVTPPMPPLHANCRSTIQPAGL